MTVELRPHHLLCMLTYVGKGYSAAFCDNYDAVLARLAAGEEILLVDGPDSVCAPALLLPDSHCRNESVTTRDAAAAAAVSALLGIDLGTGSRFSLHDDRVSAMRAAFAAGTSRAACADCQWQALCDTVAGSGFRGARLRTGRAA